MKVENDEPVAWMRSLGGMSDFTENITSVMVENRAEYVPLYAVHQSPQPGFISAQNVIDAIERARDTSKDIDFACTEICDIIRAEAAKVDVSIPLYAFPPLANVERVRGKLTQEEKDVFAKASETGSLVAELSDGKIIFINRGDHPKDYSDLDCPYCCGSGHKGDIVSPPPAPVSAWISDDLILEIGYAFHGSVENADGTYSGTFDELGFAKAILKETMK